MKFKSTLASLCLLLLSSTATAGLIFHDDEASFLSASSSLELVDFNSLTITGSQLVLDDLTISLVGVPSTFYSSTLVNGTQGVGLHTYSSRDLVFQFDTMINSFAIYTNAYNDNMYRTELFADGVKLNQTDFSYSNKFIGITSDVGFSTVTFNGVNGDGWRFDDLRYSSAQVPEPSSLAVFAAGLFGLLRLRKKA